MSVTSARVGRRAVTIEASIWVAVTTGLDMRPAVRIRRFCRTGTSASGISIPRAPRADMMPRVAAGDNVAAGRRRHDLLDVDRRLLALDLRHQRDVGAEAAQALGHGRQVG